jgi:Asp/Glu/hydantoin racemase
MSLKKTKKGIKMSPKLAMIHTVAGLVPAFDALCDELMPGVDRFHIADEGVLRMVSEAKGLTPELFRRVCEDANCAEAAGADVILVTCSSISPCVDVAQNMVSVPVLKIDQPMVDKAISIGSRVGVAATVVTTLGTTTELIKKRSEVAGQQTEVEAVLIEGAFDALLSGDADRHDQIVTEQLYRLMETNDVIVLAQASMARVVDKIPEAKRRVPILSSPRMGVERARDVINEL